MKKNTSEKWIKEFRDNVNYDEAELGCNWDMNQLEDFIHKTRKQASQETIDGLIEWAEKSKLNGGADEGWFGTPGMGHDSALKDLIHHLNSLK